MTSKKPEPLEDQDFDRTGGGMMDHPGAQGGSGKDNGPKTRSSALMTDPADFPVWE